MGQNLYEGMGSEEAACRAWYSEISDYSWDRPGCRNQRGVVGHFTQLIWNQTTHVGMAMMKDGSGYICANYYPAGNCVTNETVTFARCVLPLKPAFAWRPRNPFEVAVNGHFRRIAEIKHVVEGDDGLLLSAADLACLYSMIGEAKLAKAVTAISCDENQIHAGELATALCREYSEQAARNSCMVSMETVVAFVAADTDQDNKLSNEEFRTWLADNVRHDPMETMFNRNFTDEEAQKLLHKFDHDNDGFLTYDNLQELLGSDLLVPRDESVLLQGWSKDADRLLKDVPRAGDLKDVMEILVTHLRAGDCARVLISPGKLHVKLVKQHNGRRPTFQMLSGTWTAPAPRAPRQPAPAKSRPGSRASSSTARGAKSKAKPRAKSIGKA